MLAKSFTFLVFWFGLGSAGAACTVEPGISSVIESNSVRIVTLNLAHGRKDGINQLFQKKESIHNNLLEVAELLKNSGADVVALQEADAESTWSGKFDHVALVAENSGLPCIVHGTHASNAIYHFGTALLSSREFNDEASHSFKPTKPTTTKGFVLGALKWNPAGALPEPLQLKFVSVHLDWSRRSVRRSQIDEMVAVLSGLDGPMVLLGDFNTDWQTEDSSLKYLAEQLNFSVFDPHAEGMGTYGDKGARLDWILISPELEFRKYAVVPDVVSDHYAVAADIVLKGK